MLCNPQAQCQEVRKRKELELQILTEPIRSWEGDDIKTLGSVTYMSQVTIQCAGSEVLGPTFTPWLCPTPKVCVSGLEEWRVLLTVCESHSWGPCFILTDVERQLRVRDLWAMHVHPGSACCRALETEGIHPRPAFTHDQHGPGLGFSRKLSVWRWAVY